MSQSQRLFFALWPSPDFQRECARQARGLLDKNSGRFIGTENLHLTLAFLGDVSPVQRDDLIAEMDQIFLPSFHLLLDRMGYWRKPKVVWLGCTQVPAALDDLVAAIRRIVTRYDISVEKRAYHPHLTVMRKAVKGPRPTAFTPLPWQVNEFVLVESKLTNAGAQYSVIKRWPLVS